MTGIGPGTALKVPQGYKNLLAGQTYYFLRSSPITGLVTLVRFVARPPKRVEYKNAKKPKRNITPQPMPVLEKMPRKDFEDGVGRHIVPGERSALPPWLQGLAGLDLNSVDAERRSPSKTHADRVDEKLLAINPLLQRAEEIIDSDDPEKLINQHARKLEPLQNETRVRLWFFT